VGDVRRIAVSTILFVLFAASDTDADRLDDARLIAEGGDRSRAVVEILDLMPTLPELEKPRATFLLASITEDWESAVSLYTELVDGYPESPWSAPALIRLGEADLLQEDPARAFSRFEEATTLAQLPEDHAKATFRTGQALLMMDRPAEARLEFDRALEESRDETLRDQAILAVATCAYREGDYSASLKEALDLAHREGAVTCDANFLVARSFLARGEVLLALEYFGELAREFPDTREAAVARHLADSLGLAHAPPEVSDPVRKPVREVEPKPMLQPPTPSEERHGIGDDDGWSGGLSASEPETTEVFEGLFYVQLGAFSERVRALSFLSGLRRRNIENVTITGALEGERRIFRVRAGPYPDRGAADEAQRHLESVTGVTGFVTEES